MRRAKIRSLWISRRPTRTAPTTSTFGPKAPAGKEGMWIKTILGKGWWGAFRIYGPQAPAFDGTWKLNDIAEVK